MPADWTGLPGCKRLSKWRTDTGLTQRQVADHLDIDATSYSSIERGVRRPNLDLATRIEKMTEGRVRTEFWSRDSLKTKRTNRAA